MIEGLVLCGGRSSRMGTDKSLLPFEGVPMVRRVADALLAGGCDRVRAVGGDAMALAPLGLEVVPDGWPGEGPLGGVLTALEACLDADVVVVTACDLPNLGAPTIASLLDGLRVSEGALAAVGDTGRVEPLCAAWRPSAAPVLRAALDTGERRLHAVLIDEHTVRVSVPVQDLVNINAPGDLGSSV